MSFHGSFSYCWLSCALYESVITMNKCTRWRSRLRYWATSRKVTGSIPGGVIGIFHWHNPGSTHPLTEMSIRNISLAGKGGRCVGLTTLPPSCADCHEIWESQPPGTLRACTGIALPMGELIYMSGVVFYWNPQVWCLVLLLFWVSIILPKNLECCSQLFISFAWHHFNFTQRALPKFPNIWLGTVTNTFV
jgi:hypothetical protein